MAMEDGQKSVCFREMQAMPQAVKMSKKYVPLHGIWESNM